MARRTRPILPAAVAAVALLAAAAAGEDAKKPEAKKEPPPPKKAAVAVPPAAADNEADAFELQYGPYFRQMYRSELHLMRLSADPTREQFEKIAAASEPAVKATVKKFSEASRTNTYEKLDPRQPLAEAIGKAARVVLPPEQADRYQKELDLRAVAHKRTVVAALVNMTDQVLVLSTEQREKLAPILADNWQDSWNHTRIFMYGGRYFPAMPAGKVEPVLTPAQRAVWKDISKGNVRFGFSMGGIFGNVIEVKDEVWNTEPPSKTPAGPEAKP